MNEDQNLNSPLGETADDKQPEQQPLQPAAPAVPASALPTVPITDAAELLEAPDVAVGAQLPPSEPVTEPIVSPIPPIIDPAAAAKKARRRRKIIAWTIAVILLLALAGAAAVYYFKFFQPTGTTPQGPSTSYTTAVGLLYRGSTIPTGSASLNGGKLIPVFENLPVVDPAFYHYNLQLAKVSNGELEEAAGLMPFWVDEEGKLFGENGQSVTFFSLGDHSAYNTIQLVLSSAALSAAGGPGVILTAPLPAGGGSIQFDWPLDLKQGTGSVTLHYDADTKKTNLDLDLQQLPDIGRFGWEYEGWLVKMNGPWVEEKISLGVFEGSPAARHSFETSRRLSGYNKLVIGLKPVDVTGGSWIGLLPFSADLTVR